MSEGRSGRGHVTSGDHLTPAGALVVGRPLRRWQEGGGLLCAVKGGQVSQGQRVELVTNCAERWRSSSGAVVRAVGGVRAGAPV